MKAPRASCTGRSQSSRSSRPSRWRLNSERAGAILSLVRDAPELEGVGYVAQEAFVPARRDAVGNVVQVVRLRGTEEEGCLPEALALRELGHGVHGRLADIGEAVVGLSPRHRPLLVIVLHHDQLPLVHRALLSDCVIGNPTA
nr:MAG TPA: hypothetical protein [Bacteriophage sp.]